jgi:hypothetical protein
VVGAFRETTTTRRKDTSVPPPVAPIDQPTVHAIPDEEFWASLKAETTQWIGGRR